MDGIDLLGAEPVLMARKVSLSRTVFAGLAGFIAAALTPKHPVLAFIGVGALASNAHAVATGDRTLKQAMRRMGRHVIATAGSLALPPFPLIGYGAGAVAGELLFDGEGGGIIEELLDYEGVTKAPAISQDNIIDAEFTEAPTTKALVKR